ncbi:MAG: acetolactate synthase small subunit [Candidatus Marinimicrobia bacterium]|nr:acetolactate synthase small subunit [Candidatus Neomarinimicrobiota bacterium]
MSKKHTIIATVTNRVGILARVTGLLAQRGYNIESAIAAPTEDPDIYKITLVVKGTEDQMEQVTKQLNKLIDVIKVIDISHENNYIVREYIIMKVNINRKNRSEVLELMNVFSARPLDVDNNTLTMELSARARKIDRLIALMKPFGINEYVRSGEFAMTEDPRRSS